MTCCHEKEIIKTDNAPKAIGPYSAGVRANHFIYTAGQIGLDPNTQEVVPGGVDEETKRALMNIKGILEAAGSSLEHVVKTTVFLRDMNDFSRMNAVYGTFFGENPPARTTVQVSGLPKGVAVEIEAVALIPCEKEHKG